MRALQLARRELQPDACGPELLGQRRQLHAAAEALVLVRDDCDGAPEARISRARVTARSSLGRVRVRVEIFSEKIRMTPADFSE